jgi:hypothetical protein
LILVIGSSVRDEYPQHYGRMNELAQRTDVTSSTPNPANNVRISVIYARVKIMDLKPKHEEFYGATTGKHLQKIDKALPGKHTTKLYNALNRTAAAIFVKLRTNISRLNTYLSKINVVDSDRCGCGMTRTVPNFLFSCLRLKNPREAMESAHCSRY